VTQTAQHLLHGCRGLVQCEERLRNYLRTDDSVWLGAFPMSCQDVEFLDRLVNEALHGRTRNSKLFVKNYPLCASLFMVWIGIRFYREGDFWTEVHKRSGIQDASLQQVLGHSFLRTLRMNDAIQVTEDRSLPFVAPILLHGGIPQSCLAEFCREIVLKRFVATGQTTSGQIRESIQAWRESAASTSESIRQRQEEIDDRIAQHTRDLRCCDGYIGLRTKVRDLCDEIRRLEEARSVQQEIDAIREECDSLRGELFDAKMRESALTDEQLELLNTADCAKRFEDSLQMFGSFLHESSSKIQNACECVEEACYFTPSMTREKAEKLLGLCPEDTVASWKGLAHLRRHRARLKSGLDLSSWLFGGALAASLPLAFSTGKWVMAQILALVGALVWVVLRMKLNAADHELAQLESSLGAIARQLGPELAESLELLSPEDYSRFQDALQHLKVACTQWVDDVSGVLTTSSVPMNLMQHVEDLLSLPEQVAATWWDTAAVRRSIDRAECLLNQLRSDIRLYLTEVEDARRKKSDADGALLEVQRLEPVLSAQEQKLDLLRGRLRELVPDLADLGDEEAHLGLLSQEICVLRKDLEALQQTLAKQEDRVGLILAGQISLESVRQHRLTVERARETLQKERSALLVGQNTSFVPQVDRPVQRFLLSGGTWAEDFTIRIVELLLQAIRNNRPVRPPEWPSDYRHELAWNAFKVWWEDEGRELSLGRKTPISPLRLVCHREAGDWVVCVKIPDGVATNPWLEVTQDGQELSESRRWPGCYYLDALRGTVQATWVQDGVDLARKLDIENWWQADLPLLLFRGWDGMTKMLPALRQVGKSSRLVVVAPRGFEPAGFIAKPEAVARLQGHMLYFLDTAETPHPVFSNAEGQSVRIDTSGAASSFRIDKALSIDEDSEHGPLIVGESIVLRCLDRRVRNQVAAIELVPGDQVVEFAAETLSSGVRVPAPGSSGVFEIAVYDRDQREMERLPFRFVPGLQAIELDPPQVPVFPDRGSGKHESARLIFTFDKDCELRLLSPVPDEARHYARGRKCFDIPANSMWDDIKWELRSAGGSTVPFQVRLGRLWWCLGKEGFVPEKHQWGSSTTNIQASSMEVVSDTVLCIKHPGPGFARQVQAGFDEPRSFQASAEGLVYIPFREFAGIARQEHSTDKFLRLQIQGTDGLPAEGVIAVLLIERECTLCTELAGTERGSRTCSTCP